MSSALFILTVFGVSLKYVSSDKLKIALLGKDNIDVIVFLNCFECCVIDLGGKAKDADYCTRYFQHENIRTIDCLYLTENAHQAISVYNKGFELLKTKKLMIPNDTVLGAIDTICGTTPVLTDMKDISGIAGEAVMQINNGAVTIRYGSFSFICSSFAVGSADVIAEYGKLFNTDSCRAVIAPQYNGKNIEPGLINRSNILITADKNGKFTVGGL